jgi:very-short-patch-repair endonuclease
MRQQLAKHCPDDAIARVAARQHGVISVSQLHRAGADPSAIKRRADAGRLHRLHRGVYAVGHPSLSDEGRWMAAVLAYGEGAVLSHRSAGLLWRILRPRVRRLAKAAPREEHRAVDVTVPGGGGRVRQEGIRLHRSSTLTAVQCTRRDGISVTRPGRTLADLRSVLTQAELAAAIREAEFLRLPFADAFRSSRNGRGDRPSPPRTRSELEARFLALVRRHRLPRPEVNVRIDRYEVDFLWRRERLVVEVDGWESHRSRSAFEQDRARDARLKLFGFGVLRFTWRQVEDDPREVARTIRGLLRAAA